MIEVLAPCGEKNSLIAAINNGANAVYLGLNNFNARAKAENFNETNIAEVVRFAHLNNVKVYVAVNILIKESEVTNFLNLIRFAVEAKVDAFIVQDLGAAKLIKANVKNAVLHASTQMGIHNLSGALVAEKFGFSRVVLSRETTLEDIKQIKKHTNLEIEYFVQGALCVAFSGNCYLSAFNKLKSGNRGRCLQPCRLKYDGIKNNINVKSGYLISPKDLELIENLKTLMEAGVTSFKIEGRLRRAGYVAVATKTYANAINAILNDDEFNYKTANQNLMQVFNRGQFNKQAYLYENKFGIINSANQNHMGVEIGTVKKVEKFKNIFKVWLSVNEKVSAGDGLKFFKNNLEVASVGVGNVEVANGMQCIFTKQKLDAGLSVYKILNAELENEFLNNVKTKFVSAKLILKENCKAKLALSCGSVKVVAESENVLEPAKNAAISKENCVKQISKFNSDIFKLENLEVEQEKVFVPVSTLNALRRNALELLENAVVQNFEKENLMQFESSTCNLLELKQSHNYVCINENVQESELKNYENFNVVIAPIKWESEHILSVIKKFKLKAENVFVLLPIVANFHELQKIKEVLKSCKIKNVISSNIWGLSLAGEFNVVAGYNHNIINNYALSAMLELGATDVILSFETSKNMLQNFNYACVYSLGTPVVMTFCHCINNTITSSTCDKCSYCGNLKLKNENNTYEIRRYSVDNCYFELLYSKTINILNKHNHNVFADLRNLNTEEFSGLFFNEIE